MQQQLITTNSRTLVRPQEILSVAIVAIVSVASLQEPTKRTVQKSTHTYCGTTSIAHIT